MSSPHKKGEPTGKRCVICGSHTGRPHNPANRRYYVPDEWVLLHIETYNDMTYYTFIDEKANTHTFACATPTADEQEVA